MAIAEGDHGWMVGKRPPATGVRAVWVNGVVVYSGAVTGRFRGG